MLDQMPLYEGEGRGASLPRQTAKHPSINNSLMTPFEFNSHVTHVITRVRSSWLAILARVKELSQQSLLSNYNFSTAELLTESLCVALRTSHTYIILCSTV